MKNAVVAFIALVLVALASIVPWADAQQKPANVLIWCQNTNGTSSPCVAGNSLDYDSGGGTVNQGTVGIALPASGGPVAGGTSTNPIRVDPTGTTTQPVSGTVTANAGTNLNTSSLLTTTAHDAAFGTAGTADSQVRTIQGIASMTPVQVQSNSANLSTLAEQQSQTTALQLIDNLPIAQSSSTSGQSGILNLGAVTTSAPTYTTGNSNPISLQTDGSQRVAVTNTPAVSQSGTWNIGTVTTLPALPANQSVNVAQINGVTPLMGAGNTGTGSHRVTIATDQAVLNGLGVYVEDAAETAGGNLSMVGTVRRDTAATSSNASGDNSTLNTDASGLLWTRTIDACSSGAKTFLPINISTATTTEITPSLAGASNRYYICSLVLLTAGANNVALVDDDSDGCGSVTSGLAGGTTSGSGFNMAANSGLTFGNGMGSVFKTNGTNRVVCLVTSAAVQLSGTMSVVAAP